MSGSHHHSLHINLLIIVCLWLDVSTCKNGSWCQSLHIFKPHSIHSSNHFTIVEPLVLIISACMPHTSAFPLLSFSIYTSLPSSLSRNSVSSSSPSTLFLCNYLTSSPIPMLPYWGGYQNVSSICSAPPHTQIWSPSVIPLVCSYLFLFRPHTLCLNLFCICNVVEEWAEVILEQTHTKYIAKREN